ncbi:hypothetical protein TeGR_g7926, partial [Tetraparma gracilis]
LWFINMEWENGTVRNTWYLRLTAFLFSVWGILKLIICRSHYTVDVALGFYFAYFISEFYMVRALNVYQGAGGIGRFIQRLESWGEEWEAAGAIGTGDEEEDKAKELLREVALRRAE